MSQQMPLPGITQEEYVTTDKKQFAHRRIVGAKNTICTAMPKYYGGTGLKVIDTETAARMHHCKRCFPQGFPRD